MRLRENQRTREHERGDLHVEETRHHAHGVVRVERGEHEVARQSGLDGDVRRLAVADFAHEHDVRVLTQHAAEHTGERQAHRRVHVHLVDAREFVFDGVLRRNDVHVGRVEVLKAGVERRGLAGTRWPCHEDDAVGLFDGVFHRLVGVFVKTKRGEAGREVRLVEDTHHHFLAVHGGEDGHAHVHLLADGLDLETAVLRFPAFGDVERAHDLDAAHDGVVEGLRRGGTLHEFAVDAVAEARGVLQCLEVDVRRFRLQGFDHHGVHHADDGGVLVRRERGVEHVGLHLGEDLQLRLVALHDGFHRKRGIGGVPRRFQARKGVRNLLLRRHTRPNVPACRKRDLFLRGEVEGIGQGNRETAAELGDGDSLDLDPEIFRFTAEQVLIDRETVRKRQGRHVEIGRRRQGERGRINEIFLHQIPFQRRLRFCRLPCDFLELFRLQHLAGEQSFRKASVMRARM